MPNYTFNWTSDGNPVYGKPSITVNDMAVNTISTDLKLYGRGARSYGEGIQENLLRLLENFANDIPPQNPTIGQLWYNVDSGIYSKGLKVFDGANWVSTAALDLSAIQSDLDSKVDRSGDTMTGRLTLSADPINNLHAATKRYVDNRDLLKVSKNGDTMSDFLTLHSDPEIPLHAATKAYVDHAIFQAFQNFVGSPIPTSGAFLRMEQYAGPNQTVFSGLPSFTAGDNSLWGVYVNGVRQPFSSYTEGVNEITFSSPLDTGDEVMFDIFVTSPSIGVSSITRQEITATAGQTVVSVLSHTLNSNLLMVWVNGVKQIRGVSYNDTTVSTITFTEGLAAGAKVDIRLITLIGTGPDLNYQHFTATSSGQTSFSISPPYYHTGNTTDPNEQYAIVFVNGILQGLNEYVEVNGTSILLSGGLDIGDHVEVYIFDLTPDI